MTKSHGSIIMNYMEYYHKKHRGGRMRATILPQTIILTKAHRAAVSIMAEGCIVGTTSEGFLIFTTQLYKKFSVSSICTI